MTCACHRCGETLQGEESFCPHCGAPQLRWDGAGQEESAEDCVRHGPGVQQPGSSADPSPFPGSSPSGASYAQAWGPGQQFVAWRTAVVCGLFVAAPVGLLSALLSFSLLWVVAGGVLSVVLYRRRSLRRVSPRAGWRIGLVTGLLAACIATAIDALSTLFERYGMHRGAEVDRRLHAILQQGIDRMLQTNPDAASQVPWFIHFWLSPYGQAALILSAAAVTAVFMVTFSGIGGALGARYFAARTTQARNS